MKSLEEYKKVLDENKSNECKNIGIRNNKELKSMTTYEIIKKALTPIYTKRMVLEDSRTCVPLLNINIEVEDKDDIEDDKD